MPSRRDIYQRAVPILMDCGIKLVVRGIWTPQMNPPMPIEYSPLASYWEEKPEDIEQSDSYGYTCKGESTIMIWNNYGTINLTDGTQAAAFEQLDNLHDAIINKFAIGYGTSRSPLNGFYHSQTMAYKPGSFFPYYYFQDGPWFGFEFKVNWQIQIAPATVATP